MFGQQHVADPGLHAQPLWLLTMSDMASLLLWASMVVGKVTLTNYAQHRGRSGEVYSFVGVGLCILFKMDFHKALEFCSWYMPPGEVRRSTVATGAYRYLNILRDRGDQLNVHLHC